MANWRNKIKIKQHLVETVTAENIQPLCREIVSQLKPILEKEIEFQTDDSILDHCQEVIDNFEFLQELADGSIPENEWGKYSFNGDFEGMGNYYLSQLYDLGDTVLSGRGLMCERFCWIG